MRIVVKSKDTNLNIPIPMFFVTTAIKSGKLVSLLDNKNIDDRTKKILNSIDFSLIARNFKDLKKYKGLNLVEVRSKDGNEVYITI